MPKFLTLYSQGCRQLCFASQILGHKKAPFHWCSIHVQSGKGELLNNCQCTINILIDPLLRRWKETLHRLQVFTLHISWFRILFNDSIWQFACCITRKRNCRKLNTKYIVKAQKDNYKTRQNCSLPNLSTFYWTTWLVPMDGEILCSIVFLLQKID